MSAVKTQHNHVVHLHAEAVASWVTRYSCSVNQEGRDVLVESLFIAQVLMDMPTNPAYWSLEDAHAVRLCLTRLNSVAERYHIEQQERHYDCVVTKVD